ncbi:hypothetical protein L6164_005926 [Bauhinia variegata]|uniref:Uncharacterized protein n=1 Tax=Bauhinia variegata TaxID=167791 RepID=A0ACB9PSM8_BAUVA|nr:hypothetical protein L6164_005926 [Bauhinia variegata]
MESPQILHQNSVIHGIQNQLFALNLVDLLYEENVCFDGGPLTFNISENSSPPTGICLEKIDNGSYLNLVPHPDGSNRVFLSNQQGKIWLASVPEEGSGEEWVIDESNPPWICE